MREAMTREQVMAMTPGREMDAAVAQRVMGWKFWKYTGAPAHRTERRRGYGGVVYADHSGSDEHTFMAPPGSEVASDSMCGCSASSFEGDPMPRYSTDRRAAWEVVHDVGGGDIWVIVTSSEGTRARLTEKFSLLGIPEPNVYCEGPGHEAEAICKAALLTTVTA